MKQSTLLLIFAVLAISIGGMAYFLTTRTTQNTAKNSEMLLEMRDAKTGATATAVHTAFSDDATPEPAATNPSGDGQGKYVVFSEQQLTSHANSRRVLFFYANWCPTCQPADQSFTQQTSRLPADVVVIRVNYNDSQTDDTQKELARKYGVTYQHTFVQIDEDGTEVAKWNGGKIDELLSNLR